MVYDCFFSYQNKDLNFVELIVAELEKRGLSCWYAPRNVTRKYAKAIAEGISHSKVFILVLNSRSAISEAVLNEVEMAHNISKNSGFAVIQPLCTDSIDLNATAYQEMMYYVRRLQFLNVENVDDFRIVADMIIKSQPLLLKSSEKRRKSEYVVQAVEDERLKIQNDILKNFDNDIYTSVLGKFECPHVLDVGCDTGDMFVPIVTQFSVSQFIGIDKSENQIAVAKKYSINGFEFYVDDVESQNFEKNLILHMSQMQIEKFEVINISMVLLHLEKPVYLLSILKKYLSPNGIVIIRDIDDGLNFAFLDPDNSFERVYKMCSYDEQSGNRRNGRQVYHDLICAGFTNIKLERQGLTSCNMSDIQKEALFQMYCSFVLENSRIMTEKYPRNIEYRDDYLWYVEELKIFTSCS